MCLNAGRSERAGRFEPNWLMEGQSGLGLLDDFCIEEELCFASINSIIAASDLLGLL
jgi:hypothetical protein